MNGGDVIAADFDRARQEMLKEFRRLAAVRPKAAAQEAEATLSTMRQICQMEAAHAG